MIRDLVVDIGDFMRKLPQVSPWIVRREEKSVSEGEYLQTPRQMEDYSQFSMCINCMLCYSACPVYGLDPEFVGPAASPWRSGTTSTPATRAATSGSTC